MITKKSAFTLVELLVVMAIFIVLSSLTYINFSRPQVSGSIDNISISLFSDLKLQQAKSISRLNSDSYGVYFEEGSYTLFTGNAYNPLSPSNFTIDNKQGITFSAISLPSESIVFDSNGDVLNYDLSNNSVTISHSSGLEKTITINKFGAIDVN